MANTRRSSHGHGCRDGEGAGGGSSGAGVSDFEEGELGGLFFFGERRPRNDFGPDLGMGSEDAAISQHVEPRRRDEGAEACEKIEGVEEDGARAVFPGSLEAVPNAPVVQKVESVLGEGRPCDVAAEALESLPVAAVDDDLGVDVDGADLGDRVVWGGTAHEGRSDELRGLVSRGVSEELDVGGGRGVAGGEDGTVVVEGVLLPCLVDHAVEGPAVTVEHADHTPVSPGGDLGDVLVGRRLERVEGQTSFVVTEVDAVEREGMEMDVETDRTVASLHKGDGADEGVLDRAESEGPLRPMAHRPGEGLEKHLQE